MNLTKLTIVLSYSLALWSLAGVIAFAAAGLGTAAIYSGASLAFWLVVAAVESSTLEAARNNREWREAKKHPRI